MTKGHMIRAIRSHQAHEWYVAEYGGYGVSGKVHDVDSGESETIFSRMRDEPWNPGLAAPLMPAWTLPVRRGSHMRRM